MWTNGRYLSDIRQFGNYREAGSTAELAVRDSTGQVGGRSCGSLEEHATGQAIGQQRPCYPRILADSRGLADPPKLLAGTVGLRVQLCPQNKLCPVVPRNMSE